MKKCAEASNICFSSTKGSQLIGIFCEIDDFCNKVDQNMHRLRLPGDAKAKGGPDCCLSTSEIMTIQILFQIIGYRNFKTFYVSFLQIYWKQYFPKLPSYQRFTELIRSSIFPLTLFTHFKSGNKTKHKLAINDYEKQLLNQRNLIETVFDYLKN